MNRTFRFLALFVLVVVLISLFFVFTTHAFGGELERVVNDNLGMIERNHIQSIVWKARSRSWELVDLLFSSRYGYYGYYDGGQFWPVLDRSGRPLSKRQRIERAAGITGLATGIGYSIGGGRGAGIGAIVGGAIAVINDSRYRGHENEVYGHYPANPVPVARAEEPEPEQKERRRERPSSYGRRWEVENRSGFRAVLHDGDPEEDDLELRPGQSVRVPDPQEGYWVSLLVPVRSGQVVEREGTLRPKNRGWEITALEEER